VKSRKIYTTIALCGTFGALAHAQQAGTISGAVIDQNSAPVAGAVVLYHNVPQVSRDASGRITPTSPMISSGVLTGVDGSFAIPNLPDGQYSVCAYGVQPNALSTCEWGRYTSPIQIAGGSTVSGISLQLAQGTLLSFLVTDPNGVIVDTASGPLVNGLIPLLGGNFRIGVMLGTFYARAEFASQQGTVRTYTVAVPSNVMLNLFADTQLQVVGQAGSPIAVGQPSITIAVGSATAQSVPLQVE